MEREHITNIDIKIKERDNGFVHMQIYPRCSRLVAAWFAVRNGRIKAKAKVMFRNIPANPRLSTAAVNNKER
jgi:hypothetical protein